MFKPQTDSVAELKVPILIEIWKISALISANDVMNFAHQLFVVIYIRGRYLEHISICSVFIQQRSICQNLLNVFLNMWNKNLYHIHL